MMAGALLGLLYPVAVKLSLSFSQQIEITIVNCRALELSVVFVDYLFLYKLGHPIVYPSADVQSICFLFVFIFDKTWLGQGGHVH